MPENKQKSRIPQLSNQARWYLCGPWPISDEKCYGQKYSNAEPRAMAELVANGLATEMPARYPHARYWKLTISGVAVRSVISTTAALKTGNNGNH